MDFKSQFLSLQENKKYTVHITDDDVICNYFSVNDKEFELLNDDTVCLSLRHSPFIHENYEVGEIGTPYISSNRWEWRGKRSDWGYPMGFGHIYNTEDILPIYRNGSYDKAWNLECSLSKNPINKKYMACYKNACLFNMPINRVQEGFINKAGNISLEYLNSEFLNGYCLDIDAVVPQYNNNTIYQENIKIRWRNA
jgi:hypothetical protein